MHKLLPFIALAVAAVLPAQAPSCNGTAPAGSLTTLFAGGVYLGTTSATAGFNQMFDLTSNSNVTINQIDLHFYDNGLPAPNPILTGVVSPVSFWTCTGTSVGNETNVAAWTQIGTGMVTIQANGTHSPAVFTPFLLPAGSYGAVVHVDPVIDPVTLLPVGSHPLYTNPATTPGTPTVYSDQYLTLTARGFQGTAWANVPALRVINTQIYYQPPVTAGFSTQYGLGCYDHPQTFYERQVGPGGGLFTTSDLSNSSLSMINQANKYLVFPSGTPIVPPTSPALTTVGLTYDDDISAPITLPWAFPYPGGTTSSIAVSTNGHVFLGASTATFGPYNMSQFFTDVPRLACAWMDLDLTTQGSMHYDVDPAASPQFVRITWQNCPEWDPLLSIPGLGSNTFQITMHMNGNVDYSYGNVTFYNCPHVVGFGRGNGTGDPGSRDISVTAPFTSGDGLEPPRLRMDARPVIGSTTNFVCSNIVAGTQFGFMVFSFGSTVATELSNFGMPSCYQHVFIPGFNLFAPVVNGVISAPLTLPNVASYNGLNVFAQAAPIVPGVNAAGVTLSNGVCIHIGLN